MVHNHDRESVHHSQLLGRRGINDLKPRLHALATSETPRKWDFSTITKLLPIEARHQQVPKVRAKPIIHAANNNHNLMDIVTTFDGPPPKMCYPVCVCVARDRAVVLCNRCCHRTPNWINQYKSSVVLNNCRVQEKHPKKAAEQAVQAELRLTLNP